MTKPFTLFGACMLSMVAARAQSPPPEQTTIRFASPVYQFDTLPYGGNATCSFAFSNTGNVPLVINSVKTSTGAATAEWPKEPIAPGQGGMIKYRYDSKRIGPIQKSATVTGNFETTVLWVKGYIRPPKEDHTVMTQPAPAEQTTIGFARQVHHFDTLDYGGNTSCTFEFTNTGKVPLVISNVYTSTGAAVAEWPKERIAPGQKGLIKYKYDSHRVGPINKSVTVTGNFETAMLRVKGYIKPPGAENNSTWEGPLPGNSPLIQFAENLYTFDTLAMGDKCEHDFIFTNTGTEPLVISSCKTTCSCDVTTWPKEPIMPGKSGTIRYKYDSNRTGPFVKTFTVTGNFPGNTKVVKVKGYIKPPKKENPEYKASPVPQKGAQIQFAEETYTFDTLDNGAPCEHDFVFTNTGTEPLIISNSQTSCGCDVTSHPREPIAPGQSGKIRYKYDSKRTGIFHKTFTVTGNFPDGTKVIKVKGYVRPPKADFLSQPKAGPSVN